MRTNIETNLKPHFKILTISSGRFLNNLLINRDISININDQINIKSSYRDEEMFSNCNINSVNDLQFGNKKTISHSMIINKENK